MSAAAKGRALEPSLQRPAAKVLTQKQPGGADLIQDNGRQRGQRSPQATVMADLSVPKAPEAPACPTQGV